MGTPKGQSCPDLLLGTSFLLHNWLECLQMMIETCKQRHQSVADPGFEEGGSKFVGKVHMAAVGSCCVSGPC